MYYLELLQLIHDERIKLELEEILLSSRELQLDLPRPLTPFVYQPRDWTPLPIPIYLTLFKITGVQDLSCSTGEITKSKSGRLEYGITQGRPHPGKDSRLLRPCAWDSLPLPPVTFYTRPSSPFTSEQELSLRLEFKHKRTSIILYVTSSQTFLRNSFYIEGKGKDGNPDLCTFISSFVVVSKTNYFKIVNGFWYILWSIDILNTRKVV